MTSTGELTLILTSERSRTSSAQNVQAAEADAPIDLAALVTSYGPLLFRVAHSILRSRTDSEDVVQDTFVRVLEHRRALPAVRDLRVWLVRIAWNLALDRRRRIRPQQIDDAFAGQLAAHSVPADQALSEARQVANLLAAIERLPKLERQVLLLSAVEELSTAEVAGVIGKSESAARSLLFRARTRLKERTGIDERDRLEHGSRGGRA
jgi:RNA polymerase sigma-70 factor (ECF subfamily)